MSIFITAVLLLMHSWSKFNHQRSFSGSCSFRVVLFRSKSCLVVSRVQ